MHGSTGRIISFTLATTLTYLLKAIGGAVWHGVKGFRNSPYGERRIGALTAIKARAPVLGGNFGVWGGLFSTYDCAFKGIRKKEDPWNASTCTVLVCSCAEESFANAQFLHSWSWIPYWWLSRYQRRSKGDAHICHHVRMSFGCNRRSWARLPKDDGGFHAVRGKITSFLCTYHHRRSNI